VLDKTSGRESVFFKVLPLQRISRDVLLTDIFSYTRGLTKSTTRLETLLKVIVTPVVSPPFLSLYPNIELFPFDQDPPESFILNYVILIGDSSFSNFQKVSVPTAKVEPIGRTNYTTDVRSST
jgi:hypothetical protein